MRRLAPSRPAAAAFFVMAIGCAASPGPVSIEMGQQPCEMCRMLLSSPTLAIQVTAQGEEPLFFDDFACLQQFHARGRAFGTEVTIHVTDHRTGEWVSAASAVFTRIAELPTPMGSHIVAHASDASRSADAAARGGQPVPTEEAVGTELAPRAIGGRAR